MKKAKAQTKKCIYICWLFSFFILFGCGKTDNQTEFSNGFHEDRIGTIFEEITTGTQNMVVSEEVFASSFDNRAIEKGRRNSYVDLKVATYFQKVGKYYFIVDCYHNQVLYNTVLDKDLQKWKVLTDQVYYPHSIAGDGNIVVVDDTEQNRVLVFKIEEDGFQQIQILDSIGMKPHFTTYNMKRDAFYTWSSITGELYQFKRDKQTNLLSISKKLKIDELYGVYVRSFTVIGDDIYFVSGHNNRKIIRAELDTLKVRETYEVTPEIAGMVQIYKIGQYFYISVSTDANQNQEYATMIRTKDLHSLVLGGYEDVYALFQTDKGVPYYINNIEGTYYMAHHGTAQNIISFQEKNGMILNVTVEY